MLNEHEERQLAEIEAAAGWDDPAFARRLAGQDGPDPYHARRRRVAGMLALAGVVGAFVGLGYGNVGLAVVAICAIGVAGAILTWRANRHHGRARRDPTPKPAEPIRGRGGRHSPTTDG